MVHQQRPFLASILLLILPLASVGATAREPAVTIAVAAESFQFDGDWAPQNDRGRPVLIAISDEVRKLAHPAVTVVQLPKSGHYRLWVCARDYPDERPGTRTFSVQIGEKKSDKIFGTSGKPEYSWEDGGWFDLPAGPLLLCLENPRPYARAQGIVLTTDAAFVPKHLVGQGTFKGVTPLTVATGEAGEAPADVPVKVTSDKPTASVETEHSRIEFLPAQSGTGRTVAVHAMIKSDAGWVDAGADPSAEGYFAVVAPQTVKLTSNGFYPTWATPADGTLRTVEAGGASVQTTFGARTHAMWQAGKRYRFTPKEAVAQGNGVRLEFYPSPAGSLQALWEPAADGYSAAVTLTFTPSADGQIALGYQMFTREPLSEVGELLLPMMYNRHRLPDRPTTLLNNTSPTPIALVQPLTKSTGATCCFAVIGEPEDVPFGWPDGTQARFAMSICDEMQRVQPAIWGPVIGLPATMVKAGSTVRLRCRVLVQSGDWYAGYRTAADRVDGMRDYRQNVRTSLSDAALNMIDLIMDDEHSGWWDRAKAFTQIETKNGATEPSPLLLLSLYRLTGDQQLYRRRALPTMQFVLSRSLPHFSPVPSDTGPYPPGSMEGPVKTFGVGVYGGFWELTGRRTNAFRDIAIPRSGALDDHPGVNMGHAQLFDEWLARYELTGDKKDLEQTCELADQYVRSQIVHAPSKDLGPEPFFYISFVPDWEGLLRLYEATGRKDYLDAAAFGARQLMTGIWTQPVIPAGDVTIHPGGVYVGDGPHMWWKGPDKFRLGYPLKEGAIVQKSVPAWSVSNIGLGFEQPITFRSQGAGRQIYEEQWAPHFLRLYRYTHDEAFLTYARDAVVGRWGNYPGYYATGLTDMPQDPRYPMTGPDVTDIYYHHIPAHLAWTIDYLVTEAEVLSDGKISFPSVRQQGYAYFDSRIFGHAPGKIYDDPSAWLFLRRGLVKTDNIQVNCITAHGDGGFHVILTNQSHEPQSVKVSLSPLGLGFEPSATLQGTLRIGAADPSSLTLPGGVATVLLPPRGIAVLTAPTVKLDVPAHHPAVANAPTTGGTVVVNDEVAQTHAAAVAVDAGPWDACIWSTASAEQATSATLHYTIGSDAQTIECNQYPFEFTVPVKDEKGVVKFHLDLKQADGKTITGPEASLGLGT